MFASFQVQKFNQILQILLKCLVQYLLIFANIKNTAETTAELNVKQQEILSFTNRGQEKTNQSTFDNYFTLCPSETQMQELQKTIFKREKSAAFVREIYEPGYSVSISHKCANHRGTKLKLIITILSDPWHYTDRKAIRETWGIYGKRKDVQILFFLGSTTDAYLEIKLSHEQKIFDDIVRCNIYDSYSNLTLKTISVLEWVDQYCSKVKYVFKIDDDVFINMPRLLTFVRIRLKLRKVIFGKISPFTKPHRNKENKYHVPIEQYKLAEFPPFVTGPAYLLSGDIIPRLYKESLNTRFLRLEDVFLTGVIAEKLGIERVDRPEFVNQRISFSLCDLQRSISLHSIKSSEQYYLWERLFECNPNCPYFCLHKSATAALVKNNFILFVTAVRTIADCKHCRFAVFLI